MKKASIFFTICLIALFTYSTSIFAASFQSLEQSAARLGNADAGTTTNTDDAAIEFYNPAGMIFVKDPSISLSGTGVLANIRMKNATATNYAGIPITDSTSSPKSRAIVPAIHIVYPVNDKVAWGFGINIPYGLETVYSENSITKYFATTSKIDTINLGLSAALKITDNFSIGAGFNAQYMWAELNQQYDAASASRALYPTMPTMWINNDILVKNTGNDWGYGLNLGLFYLVSPTTRIGFAYRSKIVHKLHGHASISGVPSSILKQLTALQLGLANSDVYSRISLPASYVFSIQRRFNPKYLLMADVEFTNWKVLKDLTLHFSGPIHLPTQTVMLKYHNAWRLAVGQSYALNNKWTLKNGFAFDQTPTDTIFKTSRIAGANRYWITFGTNYSLTPNCDLDLGYAFILFEHSHIHQINPQATASYIDADYRAHAQLLGIQLNYRIKKI